MSAPVVLGIAGSPRRYGSSDRLLEAALEGAKAAGARTERFVAAQANMRPCLGCNACSLTGECVQHDGGPAFYATLDRADAIIVASPVYFASVPAVLKICYDRLQPYWARTYVLKQPPPERRPGAFLLVRNAGDPYGFTGTEHTTRSVFAVLGIDVLGAVKVEGVDSGADLAARPEALEQAETLGRAVGAEATVRGRQRS
jgi:NAD(P)H-dependent FMN reductase